MNDPNNLEGLGRTREEMAADARELDRVAPTPAEKFALMFGNGERPTPLTDQQSIRPESAALAGASLVVTADFARELERQLAAVTEEREQVGKQAHANACEAMEYRSQLAERDAQLAEARTALGCIAKGQSWESLTASDALARIDANANGDGRREPAPHRQ